MSEDDDMRILKFGIWIAVLVALVFLAGSVAVTMGWL